MEALKKIVEYLYKDRLRSILWFFFIMHGVYGLIFLAARIEMGDTLHLVTAIIHLIFIVQLNDGQSRVKVFGEMLVAIVLFTASSTYMLGWNAGFGMYLLAMIPGMFFVGCKIEKPEWFNKVAAVGLCLSYFILALLSDIFISKQAIEWENYMTPCYGINAFLASVLLLNIGIAFEVEIRRIEVTLKDKNLMLVQMASHDALTNLFNRRVMNDLLQKAASVKEEYGRDYSICICDIDDFKKVNDTYGHDCGDYILKKVAEILLKASKTDQVARWGGEEFLILLRDMSAADSFSVINNVRKEISEYPYEYAGQKIHVTMTFGLSNSKYMKGRESMLLRADSRLYEGKQSGKNCVKA